MTDLPRRPMTATDDDIRRLERHIIEVQGFLINANFRHAELMMRVEKLERARPALKAPGRDNDS